MSNDNQNTTEVQLDAVALHFKRKYEAECQESLTLANALRDAHQKNQQLVAIAQSLEERLGELTQDRQGGSPAATEAAPGSLPN